MECLKYKDHLENYTIREPEGAFKFHLRDCPGCREKWEANRKLDLKLREVMEDVPVPGNLRQKIKKDLLPPSPPSVRQIFAAAAVILVFLGTALFSFRWMERDSLYDMIAEVIESHQKSLPVQFTGGKEIPRWFEGKLAYSVKLPEGITSDRIAGGRLCSLSDNKVAYLFTDQKESLFILNKNEFNFDFQELVVKQDGFIISIWNEGETGYCFLTYPHGGEIR